MGMESKDRQTGVKLPTDLEGGVASGMDPLDLE